MAEDSKTSEEILNELYNSLNLPVSPQAKKNGEKNSSKELSDDDSVDSESANSQSDSEKKIIDLNLCKDINDKKHKKKKRKKSKKESKLKHKKKKKSPSSHSSDFEGKESGSDKKEKISVKSPNAAAKVINYNDDIVEILEIITLKNARSRSRSQSEKKDNSKVLISKEINDQSRSKTRASHEKSRSKSNSRTIRSKSRTNHKRSSSRSYQRSPKTESRNRSSKSVSRHRRSKSRSRSRYRRSRSRSRRSNSRNRKSNSIHRKSRSKSRSRQRRSKSTSRNIRSRSKHKRSKSRSHSLSPNKDGIHKKNKNSSKSYSKSPTRRKKYRSRSKTPIKKESKDPLDAWRMAKLASLKQNNIENKSILVEDLMMKSKQSSEKDEAILESIPLPNIDIKIETASTIPLPNITIKEEPGVGLKEIPVPTATLNNAIINKEVNTGTEQCLTVKKMEPIPLINKTPSKEEGKSKTIVIKSLKDSLVFQQAEEAQKKGKEELADVGPVESITNYGDSETNSVKDAAIDSPSPPLGTHSSGETTLIKSIVEENNLIKKSEEIKEKEGSVPEIEEGELEDDDEDKEKSSSNIKKKSSRRSRSRSKHKSSSKSKKRSHSRSPSSHSKRKRSRSSSHQRRKSSSRNSRHKKSHSRSSKSSRHKRSRSRSRTRKRTKRSKSKEKSRRKPTPDCVDSLRSKATRKRLLEVARRNAVYLMQNNCLPAIIEKESVKVTGKSVEALTSFCKQLVASENYSDQDLSDPSLSPDEGDTQYERPFGVSRHPFAVKDSKPIMMNIRNAPMLPTKTNAERLADTSKLREQFPVSSGSQHRNKAEGWVVVKKDEKEGKDETVFPETSTMDVDISSLVSTRLSAMRRLQDNPTDQDAKKALNTAQKDMQDWALSKQAPGQFTGSTGARILSHEELSSGFQVWARKVNTIRLYRNRKNMLR